MARYDARRERIAAKAEAERSLSTRLDDLGDAHRADWYRWVIAHRDQVHAHDLKRLDGTPAACPISSCRANRTV